MNHFPDGFCQLLQHALALFLGLLRSGAGPVHQALQLSLAAKDGAHGVVEDFVQYLVHRHVSSGAVAHHVLANQTFHLVKALLFRPESQQFLPDTSVLLPVVRLAQFAHLMNQRLELMVCAAGEVDGEDVGSESAVGLPFPGRNLIHQLNVHMAQTVLGQCRHESLKFSLIC